MEPDLSLYDPTELRRCSSVPKSDRFPHGFPFGHPLVTLIHIDGVGKITQATGKADGDLTDKQNLVDRVVVGDVVLAAWPGRQWQDVFWVDDLEQLRNTLKETA